MLNVRVTDAAPFVAVTKNFRDPQSATAGLPLRTPAESVVPLASHAGKLAKLQVTPLTEETKE